jgi:Tfp pilus assembly protein PilO
MRAADFAFRIDDVKNADINDPATWPVSLKMLLILIGACGILFAGYWYIVKDQIVDPFLPIRSKWKKYVNALGSY